MRILFHTRPDHQQRLGGDRVVIEALRDHLIALGFQIDLSGQTDADLQRYDAVHLFNLELMPHTFLQAENARRQKRPYFLTPLYWSPGESAPWQAYVNLQKVARRSLPERFIDPITLAVSCRRSGFSTWTLARLPSLSRQRLRASVLAGAACVLASCEAERRRLLRDFPLLSPEKTAVARFGYRTAPPAKATVVLPEPGYFLCVGSFGPRKNQLNLSRALREVLGARIVFIGSAGPGNKSYRRVVLDAAPAGSIALPVQPDGALPSFYAGARAVVQPSFIELPGLVAMEAVACLCPVVAADREPVREYFEGLVTFADPASPASIRQACLSAAPPDPARAARFVAEHDWARVVHPVAEAYRRLWRGAKVSTNANESAHAEQFSTDGPTK
jgi:glycosyltransferase involved in cell wall biosynthesis